MMEARLAKVRERKQLKQPIVEDKETTESVTDQEKERKELETERQEEGGDLIASMIASELDRARERAEKVGSEGEKTAKKKKAPYVRPWDKGKGQSFW